MTIIQDIQNTKLQNTIVTLGKFDGFHIGHQSLIQAAGQLKQPGMNTVVFTFDLNPAILTGQGTVGSIQAREERREGVYPENVDYVVIFPFNKETMAMEPETFVREVLVERLGVKYIVAGYDFRFGRNRAGDVNTLIQLGKTYGFQVKVMDKVTVSLEGYPEPVEVSSTLIKEEILKGHMENVTRMLGAPFCVTGKVEHGKHLGSQMGFPTTNLRVPEDKIMPPNGVYATRIWIQEDPHPTGYVSITNVGKRPTFQDGEHRTVETNIFDFDRDIYGRTVTVEFYRFIRPERKFDSLTQLKDEIAANKAEVEQYFHSEEYK